MADGRRYGGVCNDKYEVWAWSLYVERQKKVWWRVLYWQNAWWTTNVQFNIYLNYFNIEYHFNILKSIWLTSY